MNVDKARFLLLTSALSAATVVAASASGCSVTSTDTDAGTVTPVTPGTDASTVDAGDIDAYVDGSTDDAAVCLDDTGADASCAGVNATCTTACEKYLPNFKRGVARSIVTCITALPTCDSAEMAIAACVQTALSQACTDPTAEGYCDPLVLECDGDSGTGTALDKTECSDLATGLNASGRTAFTSCVQEGQTATGYCATDPSKCFDVLE
jgi:hypothetical protein